MWLKHYKLNENEQKLVNMSNKEFDKYMMENYSEMFILRAYQEDQKVVLPMNFGFGIGSGWQHVLDNLCKKLKIIYKLTGIVCVFTQIKEKFGSARFYMHTDTENATIAKEYHKEIVDIIEDLVDMYEEYTNYVCEELGTNVSPENKVQIGSWMYGMSVEGYEKMLKEGKQFTDVDHRIKMAKDDAIRKKKLREIKDDIYGFSLEQLEELSKTIDKIIPKK